MGLRRSKAHLRRCRADAAHGNRRVAAPLSCGSPGARVPGPLAGPRVHSEACVRQAGLPFLRRGCSPALCSAWLPALRQVGRRL